MRDGIRCMWMRGGTSKGGYFLAADLPEEPHLRDAVLLRILGSPDARQIDGMGGAHPLTSKVAIVSRSTSPDADIDFLFAQVSVDQAKVDTTPNCGNILSGVGPFAIERGLVAAGSPLTRVRIRTLNTDSMVEAVVQTPGGIVEYEGSHSIDGVPGTAAPVLLNFLNVAGSVCGSLLPTGNAMDTILSIPVTCIDNGMPVVAMRAADLGCTGYESCAELEANAPMLEKLEAIRLAAAAAMGLGDVSQAVVPKMVLAAAPRNGGAISTRSFIPRRCHDSVGVFAAVSVATACLLPGSPMFGLALMPDGAEKHVGVEHPSGTFELQMRVGGTAAAPVVEQVGIVRTARALFDGEVRVPRALLQHDQTQHDRTRIFEEVA